MRRLALLPLLALAILAAPADARPVPCIADHFLASSARAALFTHGTDLYGCLRGARTARLLAYRYTGGIADSDWFAPVVSGVYAAYGELSGSKCSLYDVIVRNLRTGRILYGSSAGTYVESTVHGDCYGLPVAKIVLFGDGVAVYTAGAGSFGYEVCILDANGQRVLSGGRDVDPLSLRRDGSGVTWWQGDAWHTYARSS